MLERFQRLLDHRYLSRIGNLETLLKWGTAIALVLAGAAVVLFELITHAGVVADVFFAAAFLLVVVLVIRSVATRLRGRFQGADRPVPPPELREIEKKRKRAMTLAVSTEVDDLPYAELQSIAQSTEHDARQFLDLHFPRYAGRIETNRMLYHPDNPPADEREHFRNRMRYVADQLEKVTLALGPAEVRQPIVDQLRKAADNVADFVDAREAEEPPPGLYDSMAAEVARLTGRIDPTSLDAYRNKTRSLYFEEKHRAEALAAFDAALPFGYANPEDWSIIAKPDGLAALRLVPEILRRVADRLADE